MSSASAKWRCRSSNKAVQSPCLWDLVPKQKREQLQCHPPELRCRYYETWHGIEAMHRFDRQYWSHTRDCNSLSTPRRARKCISLLNRMHCNQKSRGQGLWNLHLVLIFRSWSIKSSKTHTRVFISPFSDIRYRFQTIIRYRKYWTYEICQLTSSSQYIQ